MKTHQPAAILMGVVFLLMSASQAAAQPIICSWVGSASDAWSDARNWSNCRGGVPRNGDTVQVTRTESRPDSRNDIPNLVLGALQVAGSTTGQRPFYLQGLAVTVMGQVLGMHLPGSGARISMPIVLGDFVQLLTERSEPGGRLFVDEIRLNGHTLEIQSATESAIGTISGRGTVTKRGDSKVAVGASAYEGLTLIMNGTFYAPNSASLGATGPGNLTTVAAGATLELGSRVVTREDFSIAGRGAISVVGEPGQAHLSGNIFLFSNTSVGVIGGSQLLLSGKITSTAKERLFEKTGAGLLTLLGTGNVWGTMVVSEGTLAIAGINILPDAAELNLGVNARSRFHLRRGDRCHQRRANRRRTIDVLGCARPVLVWWHQRDRHRAAVTSA